MVNAHRSQQLVLDSVLNGVLPRRLSAPEALSPFTTNPSSVSWQRWRVGAGPGEPAPRPDEAVCTDRVTDPG